MLSLAVCLLYIPITISWADGHEEMELGEEKRYYGYEPTPPPPPLPEKPCSELCIGTESNKTIMTQNGKAVCLVPTTERLIKQLKKDGGYNRHYVAVTMEDAEADFVNLLPEIEPTTSTSSTYPGRGRGHAWGRKHRRPRTSDGSNAGDHDVNANQEGKTLSCLEPRCVYPENKTDDGYRTCPACQRCRKLSTTLFPTFVNEVSCDKSASGLSETIRCSPSQPYFQCRKKTMMIDVLSKEKEHYTLTKKDGLDEYYLQVWETVNIEINSCCECYFNPPDVKRRSILVSKNLG